jgi:hypothetical protein
MSGKIPHDFIATEETINGNIPHLIIRPIHYMGENQGTIDYDHSSITTDAFGIYQHNANGSEEYIINFKINSLKPITGKNFAENEVLETYWKSVFHAERLLNNIFRFYSLGTNYENMKKLSLSNSSKIIFNKLNNLKTKRQSANVEVGR